MADVDRNALDAKRRDVERQMSTIVKHYVRMHVWLPIAVQRANRLNRPIRYFTLTTPQLFDVRVLEREGVLETTSRGFPGVGFCEYNDLEYEGILRGLRWCPLSYKGWFEEMVRAHPGFQQQFDFDVVNLDFVLTPFPGQESPLAGTWGAIQRLLQVQASHDRAFDLFVTFRGSPTDTNPSALSEVARLLNRNLEADLGTVEFEARVGHRDASRLRDENYLEFLCLGLPKLLIGDAMDAGFHVTRYDIYTYPRQGGTESYNIVKFVFTFEITGPGMRPLGDPPLSLTNYEEAVPRLFSQNVVDVSEILMTSQRLREKLERDLTALAG